jgi:pentatricopeptide repeat protein
MSCEKGRQWQQALQLMEDMQDEGIPADTITYNTAVSGSGGCSQLTQDMQAKKAFL